jgi:hypothetical protein
MALTQVDQGLLGTNAQYTGFKNRIINGAMVIDQRNAGASVTPTDGQYTLDRWTSALSQSSKYTVQQNAGSATLPVGFKNYLGATVGASANVTVGSGDFFFLSTKIEGYNIADLGWGTANAKTITLSFQVYSSLTGTFGGALRNSGSSRCYPFTYTVSSANTWTTISITIAGDTSGTWLSTNGIGLEVCLNLGTGTTYSGTAGSWASSNYVSATGAVKIIETNSATFYVTGVQLEKGSTATSFDYRPYGTELALAQRYYFQYAAATASNDFQEIVTRTSLTGFDITTYLPVTMRSTPTLILPSGSTYGRLVGYDSAFAATTPNVTAMYVSANNSSLSAIHLAGTNVSMTFAQGQGSTSFDTNNISVGLGLSAEL